MKKILILLSLAFVVNFSFGQVLNNTFNMKVNAVAVVSSAAPNFTINLSVTDFQLKYSGNDVLVGDYFYAYVPTGKMHRFNITAVNSKTATVINVTVNDPSGTITIFPTVGVAVARQTSLALIQQIATTDPAYAALIENHNKILISDSVLDAKEVTKTLGAAGVGPIAPPTAGQPTIAQNAAGEIYTYNGSAWTPASISNANTYSIGTTAPTYGNKKVGDIWDDTSISATKPTRSTKIWTGDIWYAMVGASQSNLSHNSTTGSLSININGQASDNTVTLNAINTPSTAIVGSGTTVAIPSTDVQGAIGDLATAIKAVDNKATTNTVSSTGNTVTSVVNGITSSTTIDAETATNTPSTAIAGSGTTVAIPSTDVQGAIGDLATAIKAVDNKATTNTVSSTGNTVTSVVNGITSSTTIDAETAINTPSTAITASSTQIAIPSTDVQGAIGDLATEVKTAQEISYSATLPTSASSKIGNKVLYINSQDTTELTYLGSDKWRANYIKSATAPAKSVTSGSQTIDYTLAVWVNSSLNNKQFILRNGTFRPIEGDYFVEDFGILTSNTGTQNSAAWLTLQTALSANPQVKNVIFREGTYHFKDSIIVKLDYNIKGISKYNTILHFDDDKGFCLNHLAYSANIHISDMTIEGSNGGTIGTYERYKSGIYSYTSAFDRWNCEYKNLIIRFFKGSGVDCKNHFTTSYIGIEVDKNNGHGFDEDGGNTLVFNNCYAQTIANWFAGYRIHTSANLYNCNGLNSGKYWGIFGDNLLEDGRNAAANVNMYSCNLESYSRAGIMYKITSGGVLANNSFAPTAAGTVIILGRNQTGGGSYVDLQNVKVQNCGLSAFVDKSLLMDTIRTSPIFEQVGETQSTYSYKSLFGNTKQVSINRKWELGSVIGEQDYLKFVNNLTANSLDVKWLLQGTNSDSLLVSNAGTVKRLHKSQLFSKKSYFKGLNGTALAIASGTAITLTSAGDVGSDTFVAADFTTLPTMKELDVYINGVKAYRTTGTLATSAGTAYSITTAGVLTSNVTVNQLEVILNK